MIFDIPGPLKWWVKSQIGTRVHSPNLPFHKTALVFPFEWFVMTVVMTFFRMPKGGYGLGGCVATPGAKLTKASNPSKPSSGCCYTCFSRAVVSCHWGWEEAATTVKTTKTVKRYTHPLDHIPSSFGHLEIYHASQIFRNCCQTMFLCHDRIEARLTESSHRAL